MPKRVPGDLRAYRASNLAKRVVPILSKLLLRLGVTQRLGLLESLIALVQGKGGSGSNWDIGGEVAAVTRVLNLALDEHKVVIDVGANVGLWSTELLSRLNNSRSEIRLIAVEPSPYCLEDLEALAGRGAEILPVALSDQSGEGQLRSRFPGAGSASLYAREDSYSTRFDFGLQTPVTLETLDDVVETHAIEHIHFLKIDVEGHEYAVIQGAEVCLTRDMIDAISFEFGAGNVDSRTYFRDFWQVLTPRFILFRLVPGGKLLRIESYYEDLEYFRSSTVYFAVRSRLLSEHGLQRAKKL